MIKVKRSKIKYDGTGVATKEELFANTCDHVYDVAQGLELFITLLKNRIDNHDFDKIANIDTFYNDFQSGFRKTDWWESHRAISRHHITAHKPKLDDVNLIDVLEMIVDCVMSGMARSGSVYEIKLPPETLQLALKNTVKLLMEHIELVEDDDE